MPNAAAFNWDSVPKDGDAQVARKLFTGDGASLRRVEIKAGATADLHSHPHEQFVVILQGTGRLECDAGTVALRPDTVILSTLGLGTAPCSIPTPSCSRSTCCRNAERRQPSPPVRNRAGPATFAGWACHTGAMP